MHNVVNRERGRASLRVHARDETVSVADEVVNYHLPVFKFLFCPPVIYSKGRQLRGTGDEEDRQLSERGARRSAREAARKSDSEWHGSRDLPNEVPVGHGKVPHQTVAQESNRHHK